VTANVADIQANKKSVRRAMRLRRASLSSQAQRSASRALYRRLVTSSLFRFSRRIAFTIARDGEIDTRMLTEEAWRRGKQCYLPVMSRVGETRLTFRQWRKDTRMQRSYYDIPEPRLGQTSIPAASLSLVLFPLVAFDKSGNRLGMGKGYYDHTFAFKHRSVRKQPALIGLAHDCQRTESLPTAPWDVPLEAIVTDQYWYTPQTPEKPI